MTMLGYRASHLLPRDTEICFGTISKGRGMKYDCGAKAITEAMRIYLEASGPDLQNEVGLGEIDGGHPVVVWVIRSGGATRTCVAMSPKQAEKVASWASDRMSETPTDPLSFGELVMALSEAVKQAASAALDSEAASTRDNGEAG